MYFVITVYCKTQLHVFRVLVSILDKIIIIFGRSRLWRRFIGKSYNRRPICHVLFLHKLRHSLHDFVSRISGCAREKAIVFSIGTIVLNPPFSSPHLLSPSSAITRFLLAAKFRSGNSRRYNYLRYPLTSPPALTCFEELKFY